MPAVVDGCTDLCCTDLFCTDLLRPTGRVALRVVLVLLPEDRANLLRPTGRVALHVVLVLLPEDRASALVGHADLLPAALTA